MSITEYANQRWLDKGFGAVNYTPPATMYMALSTTTVTGSGTNLTEPASGSYARVAITNDKTEFSSASSGSLTNLNAITFPESSGSWGTITYVALTDASGVGLGNVWYYEALPVSKVVQDNTTVEFSASALSISMTN